jgi:prolipoprotein diacylglyceryl transferase
MYPILQIGPLAIQLPGLLLIGGVWLAILMVERSAPRHGIPAAAVNNMIFYSLIAGIVGARLGYVIRYFDTYRANPLSALALDPNTLSVSFGCLVAFVAALIYGQRKELPLWPTLDALTPGVAVFMLALGFGHLASGDAFGAPTSIPWGIELWGAKRHPSQVYEILGAGLILLIVVRAQQHRWVSGMHALLFIGLSAAMRLFLEAFRGDSVLLFAGIRQAQVASLAILLAALVMIRNRVRASSENA